MTTYGSTPQPEQGKDDLRRSVSSHWELKSENSYEALHGIAPKHIHNAFVMRVYGLLGAELVLTALVSGTITLVPSLRNGIISFQASNPITYMVLMLVALLGSLCFLVFNQHKHPINMFALGLFVFIMSIDVGAACAVVYANGAGTMILVSVAITAVIFLALTVYTWVRDVDFSYMGAFLFVALCALILLGFVNIFLQLKFLHILYCCLGILIFCGYILFDTWQLKTKFGADPDMAIMASIELYLDIINLFLFILSLLGDR